MLESMERVASRGSAARAMAAGAASEAEIAAVSRAYVDCVAGEDFPTATARYIDSLKPEAQSDALSYVAFFDCRPP